jgi:hypothetical protein
MWVLHTKNDYVDVEWSNIPLLFLRKNAITTSVLPIDIGRKQGVDKQNIKYFSLFAQFSAYDTRRAAVSYGIVATYFLSRISIYVFLRYRVEY